MNDTRASAESVGSVSPTEVDDTPDTKITLTDVLVAIGEQKYFVLRSVLIAAVIGIAISFFVAPSYVAQTVLMPPQQNRSGVAALAGLGALGALGGAIGVKTPDEIYVGLLQSDAVANDLIGRFKLKERYNVKLASDARTILRKKVLVTSDRKSGFITVTASDRSPEFAAKLANAYIEELRKLLDRLAITDAQQRRVFYQQQIDKTLSRLSEAQVAFDQARRKSGVVSLDEQVSSSIRASADLKAKIAALEVRLQSMRSYATVENPEVMQILAQIDAMRGQLKTLEGGDDAENSQDRSDADASAKEHLPGDSAALANIRAYREVKYQEVMLDQLRQQLELAQVDEAREGPLVQQVDVAAPPDRRSASHRSLIVLAAVVVGGLFGSCVALTRKGLHSRSQFFAEFARIRRAWRLRGEREYSTRG